MTRTESFGGEHGATVILIGGAMTVEGGVVLDSRQPVESDPESRIMRTSLGGSMLWWLTVISLVNPILDDAGGDAFALVLGARTLLQLQPDGSVRRIHFRSLFSGSVSEVELVRTGINEKLDPKYEHAGDMEPSWTGESMGEIGLRYAEPRRRWRVLNGNEWYLNQAGPTLHPAVIVDTTDSILHDTSFEALEKRRLFRDPIVLVMPHTPASEHLIKGYAEREQRREPLMPLRQVPRVWDPMAPPDPVRYSTLVPINASFGVTALMQQNEWRDPSELEAARALLQARFDLRIGIWDLVRNPVLRSTLLETVPVMPAPANQSAIPAGVAKRAHRLVAARVNENASEAAARGRIHSLLGPLLNEGWTKTNYGYYRFNLKGAFLALQINKRQTTVILRSATEPVRERLHQLAHAVGDIAIPGTYDLDHMWPVLWREQGGWADDVSWRTRTWELVTRTRRWSALLNVSSDGMPASGLSRALANRKVDS